MTRPHKTLENGQNVVLQESQGLAVLAAALDERFVQAVETILDNPGHLIVVGLGKSGHIGRKIAASFASTGTPAFFLHPTEAAHGDLGMITAGLRKYLALERLRLRDLRTQPWRSKSTQL